MIKYWKSNNWAKLIKGIELEAIGNHNQSLFACKISRMDWNSSTKLVEFFTCIFSKNFLQFLHNSKSGQPTTKKITTANGKPPLSSYERNGWSELEKRASGIERIVIQDKMFT